MPLCSPTHILSGLGHVPDFGQGDFKEAWYKSSLDKCLCFRFVLLEGSLLGPSCHALRKPWVASGSKETPGRKRQLKKRNRGAQLNSQLNAAAWVIPYGAEEPPSQPTGSWEIINQDCFKPLNVGVVHYTVTNNWNTWKCMQCIL